MSEANDWLFEIIWDLSDRAQDARMPVLAEKLEEAMDAYLAETRPDSASAAQFQSRRYLQADTRIMARTRRKRRAPGSLSSILSAARVRAGIRQRKTATTDLNRLTVCSQVAGVRFAWPL